MHSLLIISSDKQQCEAYAAKICEEQHIDSFDITVIEQEETIGIADVRNMQKKLFLKPFKSQQKVIMIKNAHTATTETQNALLKVLEEPPAHTLIILTAANKNAFLPTILSRCKIIILETSINELTDETIVKLQEEFREIIQSGIGYKLKIAQDLAKDKEKTIEWLNNMIQALRLIVLKKAEQMEMVNNYILILQSLQKAYTSANNTNVNLRFLLENLFLNV